MMYGAARMTTKSDQINVRLTPELKAEMLELLEKWNRLPRNNLSQAELIRDALRKELKALRDDLETRLAETTARRPHGSGRTRT